MSVTYYMFVAQDATRAGWLKYGRANRAKFRFRFRRAASGAIDQGQNFGRHQCAEWLGKDQPCLRMRALSRCQSRSLCARRLSCCLLPVAMATSTLTRPRFQYMAVGMTRSEEHTSELQSRGH